MKPSCPEQRFEELNRERRAGQVRNRSKYGRFNLFVVSGFLILNGCAAFEIRTQITTLSESGFLARIAETPRQREAYAALPPYQLLRGVMKGNAFYTYKDQKNGVVYTGNEENYMRYMERMRRLVAFYETTEEKIVARDMDGDLQSRCYGSWDYSGTPRPTG
jgi:hypothetical protein